MAESNITGVECRENAYLLQITSSTHTSEILIGIALYVNLIKTNVLITVALSIKNVLSIQVIFK